jgi:cation diffusion facilitator CzcD-associated flavoprotein CzcO
MSLSALRTSSPRIIIAGAGMSGLCLAIQLKRAAIRTFQVFEKSSDVGGTWLDNHYPNSGCDIPSHLYSFSFDRRHDWSQKYARQPEILRYFQSCADKFEVRPFIQFETGIEDAVFDESAKVWRVTTSDGQSHEADVFISAVGQLNRPKIPHIDGADEFQGTTWHSARWRKEIDLTGKDVAVIGNGASAIQFLPGLSQQAKSVTLFQRSPNWIHPLNNYRYPAWAKWAFRWLPFAQRLHRGWIFLLSEARFVAFGHGENFANREYRRWLTRLMKKKAHEEIQSDVIPDYPPGCKRILLSSDYLETLNRDNVRLISAPLEKFDATGVVTEAESIPVDAAIFATGFETTGFLQPMRIVGRDGVTLEEAYQPRPKTLLGMMTAGFPNLFMLYGPNTNLGHNSIIFMVECQVNYLLKCLNAQATRKAQLIEPKPEAVEEYDRRLQEKLDATIWAGDCASWYKNAQGSIVNNWWGTATAFWRQTRKIDTTQMNFEG